MRATFKHAALALALALPLQSAAAAATTSACLTPREIKSVVAFAMPSVLTGVIDHCSAAVPSDGFMRRNGPALIASYAQGKQAAWPVARQAFFKLAGDKDKSTVDMVAGMPDAALQPFVEGMIGGMIGQKLKPGQCVMADNLMRLLSPLPASNTVELVGILAGMAGDEQKPGSLPICKS
ncbi:hypothetical protein ACFO0A_08845 [Novosphingobium tardum]|uniref:Uncharacterized protein n=1 Tax=Novosphingobium tardum TaxID=1538021 RepID=A0ABV8RQH1_9SPHN